ncbi:unnamed protein product [Musa banksii]
MGSFLYVIFYSVEIIYSTSFSFYFSSRGRKRRPPLSSCSSSAPPNTRANHSISSSSTSFASSITPAEFESVLATHRPPLSSRSAAQWAGQKRETPATTPRVSTLAITVDEESEKVAPQVSSLPPSACANACGPGPGPTVAPLISRSSHLITSSTASSSTSTISSSSSSDIIGTSASSDSWSCSTVVRQRGISLPSTSISGQRGVDRDQWQVRP